MPGASEPLWWSGVSGNHQGEANRVQALTDQGLAMLGEDSAQEWQHQLGMQWNNGPCPRVSLPSLSLFKNLPRESALRA